MPVTTSVTRSMFSSYIMPRLFLADALQDDLLRGLRGDAAEAFRRDVLAPDLFAGTSDQSTSRSSSEMSVC